MRGDKSRKDKTGLGLEATATSVKTLHWIAFPDVQKGYKMGTKGVRDGYNQGRQDGTGLEAAAAPVQANHVRHQSRQGSIKSTFSFLDEQVFNEQIPISGFFIICMKIFGMDVSAL